VGAQRTVEQKRQSNNDDPAVSCGWIKARRHFGREAAVEAR